MGKGRPRKFELPSKEYLIQKYSLELLSTVQIGKLLGCSAKSVNYILKKYEIPTRNLSESHLTLSYKFNGNRDILFGSLLGDGSLLRRNKEGLASFSKVNIGYDHIWFVGNAILSADPSSRIYEYHPAGGQTTYKFTTLMCGEFLNEYLRWYPNSKKIVPLDLKLTPTIILHWFMDDGHCSWRNKLTKTVNIDLSTESFTKDNCEYLIGELDRFSIKTSLRKSHGGYGYKLYVKTVSHIDFFDLIGPCPKEIDTMKYKWKLLI